MISSYRKQLESAVRKLKSYFGKAPDLAIVFGSGLGEAFLKEYPAARRLRFDQVPHFAPVTVAGHAGELLDLRGKKARTPSVIVLNGRLHYYEGLSPQQVVFPLRALAMWGVRKLILTNSAGSISPRLHQGDLVLIRDHLNLTGTNPLIGINLDFLGPRFPSLVHNYQNPLSASIQAAAKRVHLPLKSGIYVGLSGPSYETDAEVKAFHRLGGDVVGMSTVLEAIAASHAGMEVAGISVVVNECLKQKSPLRHEEVLEMAGKADIKLGKLLGNLVK